MSAPSLDSLRPGAADYARLLMAAGFTVYVDAAPRRPGLDGWFHYSRMVQVGIRPDGSGEPVMRECFGTFDDGSTSLDRGPHHRMPIVPSRLNGSSAMIGARYGDPATLGLDNLDPLGVAYAEAVARPKNWCPFNAEPTVEAVTRARGGQSVPQRFYGGAVLANAKPRGIRGHYLPASAA